jgi:hypothetical protein
MGVGTPLWVRRVSSVCNDFATAAATTTVWGSEIILSASQTIVCDTPKVITLTARPSAPLSYDILSAMSYSFNGGPWQHANTTTVTVTATSTYTAKARYASGCESPLAMKTVTVADNPPTITFTGNYKTVTVGLNRPIPTWMTYETANATTVTATGLPSGMSLYYWGNSSDTIHRYSIDGVTSAIGTYTYIVTAVSSNSCPNASDTGAIIVRECNSIAWSGEVTASVNCTSVNKLGTVYSGSRAEYIDLGGRRYYNWSCVSNNFHDICYVPWRPPTRSDFELLISCDPTAAFRTTWGSPEYVISDHVAGMMTDYDYGYYGKLWMDENTCNEFRYYELASGASGGSVSPEGGGDYLGYVVRCVQDVY